MKHSPTKHAPGKSGRKLSGAASSVESEIERLEGEGITALRDYWARRFRRPAPPIQSADLLHRLIAWQLQVEAYGDLDAATKQMIARLIRARNGKGALPRSMLNPLKTGSVLVREWRGLTQIARMITGTRWSGPRFFGLEAPCEGTSSSSKERP